MRPERSRDTGRAARVARARLLVKADLPWIGGLPAGAASKAGLAWVIPPGAGRPARATVVDRASLHRATRALAELELRFGDSLDEVLGEPDAWMRGARATIELLKPFVHDPMAPVVPPGAALESGLFRDDVVRKVRGATDSLRPLLRAAAWIALVAPGRLARMGAFVLANGDAIEALQRGLPPGKAETAALHLTLLADEESPRRVAPLARLLASLPVFEVPTAGVDYARALSKTPRGPRPPRSAATLGPALADHVTVLLAAETPARRGALALLAALDLGPAVAEWSAWWARVASCERLTRSQPESDGDALARAKATHLAETAPRELRGYAVTSLLRGALARDEPTVREAHRALVELPALERGVAVRLTFLDHWEQLAEDARPGALAPLLRAFASYLVRTRSCGARRLLPWARILDRERRPVWGAPPDGELLEDVAPARWPAFYDALARAVEDGASDLAQLTPSLVAIAPLEGDAAHALELARSLSPSLGRVRGGPGLRAAFELCGTDAAQFGQSVAVIGKTDAEAERGQLLRGLATVRRSGGDELARALLLEDADQLVSCGRRLAVLALARKPLDIEPLRTAPVDPPWASTYPAWVQPSLRRLAESDAHAERTSRRLLGDDVRSTAAIRRELEHLESVARAGGASDRMRRRGANLRARLASPGTVGHELRAHLVAKVERAARRAKLARFEGSLEARMRAGLVAWLEVGEPPPWLFAPRTVAQLAPVASFEPAMRALALRVLRARAGPPPWDLRDDPANRAYLERLRRAGVDVAPWLDGVGPLGWKTAGGSSIELRLEDDPLEILDMGKHFTTCLSPGAMNYFSTFANIADANKRVLFARDASGKVVARCLLALTAAGALVTFHPYAHDPALGFAAVVASFARDLAARMGVVVVPHGEVPRLVSPDWYDDGPVDLGERFPFLQDGAPFRQALATSTPVSFVDEATRLFAPLPLGALTLPLLVALPEVDARPELLLPLLPKLAAADGLPVVTLARALGLLARTPEAAAASRVLVPRVVAGLRRTGDHEHGWLEDALRSVVGTCPSDALRLLRATRARGVRSWGDEDDPGRLEMAARATEALRRPRAAIALYRLAAEHAWSAAAGKALRAKADALQAGLRAERP